MPRPEDSKSSPENKGKSPAFQFYPKDFICDGKVLAMPLHVRGAYITMLCLDWIDDGIAASDFNGLSGLSPDDNGIGQLSRCFVEHPTKPGYLTNPRLLKERNNQKERSGKAKDAAAKRWDEPSKPQALPTVCTPSPTSSSSTTSINNKKRALSSADFEFPEKLNRIECKSAVDGWITHRTELKKPITKSAIEQLLKKYAERPSDLVRDIRHSVMNGWQGLFAPKVDPPKTFNNSNGNQQQTRPIPKPRAMPWDGPGFIPETRPLEELKKIKGAG